MEHLDDNGAAVSLVSLDMSKAFNRMDHNVCISKLTEQGISNQSIHLVSSFLRERSMGIKLGRNIFSLLRHSPQGKQSRNILFCVAKHGFQEPRDSDAPEAIEETNEEEGASDYGL